LLDALPERDFESLARNLTPISFDLNEVIYEPGEQIDVCYFPTTCHISLLYTTIDGVTTEMGVVGHEGVVGTALFMGGDTSPNQAVVQGAGQALSLRAHAMHREFGRGGEFQTLLLRYTQSLITQISQTAVCNRMHTVEQRLCRSLLMTRDRTLTDELQMTQEFLSNKLGVRREGVTHAARDLQERRLISYVRGKIKILDRSKLERCSCECYKVVQEESQRLRFLASQTSFSRNAQFSLVKP
jgi:CRP-like cAMP-binding protein